MSQTTVTLLLPGYTTQSLPNDDTNGADNKLMHSSAASNAASNSAFSFADTLERQPWQSQLASILGLDTDGGMRLPSARIGFRDVGVAVDAAHDRGLVRADPICLKADRDSATLIAPEQLGLTESEADELLDTLNSFVAEDGFRFFRHGVAQWYMSGLDAKALASYPPSFLANRKASTFLPDGDGAAPWRRLMTEVQMLLHTHPVNMRRESVGLIPVNSVWFWGGALPPEIEADNLNIELFAEHDQARTLAAFVNLAIKPLSEFANVIAELPQTDDLVVLDTALVDAWLSGDASRLEEHLARVNEQWLEPLGRLVAEQHVAKVLLLTEDGLQGLCNMQTLPVVPTSKTYRLLSRLRTFLTQ